jgi:hypothetical protein
MSLTEWPDLAASPIPPVVSRGTEATVYLPPLEEVARRWNEVSPLLDRATSRTGCYEPIDLLMLAGAGQVGIWFCARGEAIDAVVVTQIVSYPRRRVMEVLFAGGSNMPAWRKKLVAAIDKHARGLGCTHVASAGRPGWVRAWGAEATGDIIMVREL